MTALDPRTHAYRNDIADIALADRIVLPHYVAPVMRRIGRSLVNLFAEPSSNSELGSQLLLGEGFALLDSVDEWAWGYGLHDHFVGFVRKDALVTSQDATHIISARSTQRIGTDSDNNPTTLFMGSRVAGSIDGAKLVTDDGTIALADTQKINEPTQDFMDIAEAFIDVPYLMGGRSALGIDCSGLVQVSLAMAGHSVERDSDLQQASIGQELTPDMALTRGDLVFFPEHVGLMIDGETLLHASGHNGAVSTEPLTEVITRIAEDHDAPVLARRRPIA